MDHARQKSRIGAVALLVALAALFAMDVDWMGANGDGGCGCDAAITSAMILLG
jgi:hypothetical protein